MAEKDSNVNDPPTAVAETSKSIVSELETVQDFVEQNLEQFQENKQQLNTSVSLDSKLDSQIYTPGPLQKMQTSLNNVRQRLLSLIQNDEVEEAESTIIYIRPDNIPLEEIQKISLVSHSLASLIGTYDEYLVRKVALQIFSETTLWVNRLFRFPDSMAYFHRDTKEGLLRVIRLVLHMRYPKYSSNGYEALYTRPPIIYYNGVSWPGLEHYILSELGLPLTCLVSIPIKGNSSSSSVLPKMDPSVLEKQILDDTAAARTPLMVIAAAGSALLGQVDDLQKLSELCRAHNIWLHIDGHALASVSLNSTQDIAKPVDFADSMTLYLGRWIGVPDLASITLYMREDTSNIYGSGLGQSSHAILQTALPIWISVQVLGQENILKRIKHSFDLALYLLPKIQKFPEFRILSEEKCVEENSSEEKAEDEKNVIAAPGLFNDITPVLIFQYRQVSKAENGETSEFQLKNPLYFDNLNSWLVQLLARNVPTVRTDIIDLDNYGICLRVCFLESAYILGTENKDIENYATCLEHQLSILNATAKQRELLYTNHNKYPKLRLVEMRDWAGMGGVRYIPEVWVDRLNELTDTGKEDINHLNSELVAKLKASDSAFSVGEADDGMLCVRFGMVDEDLNMDELIQHVIIVGKEIEDSSKFLETMAEMVKHGIEEANKELVLENQEKLMQEGILKQVPVIGSLVSWWYPSQTETGIKGRSFDLSSGTIESTENIYKYHMQIKEGVPHTPPPSTKVQISPVPKNTSQTSNNQALQSS